MALRCEIAEIVERLAASTTNTIDLDVLAEALGATPVSSEEIGEMIDELTSRGFTVGDPDALAASAVLERVLRAARELRQELSRTPSQQEIAERSGLGLERVRLGLFFARMLSG